MSNSSNNQPNDFVAEMRELLSKCVVHCKFTKKGGDVAEVVGTTNLKFIPSDKHPKTTGPDTGNTIKYFDLDKQDWRSMQTSTTFIPLQSWKSLPKKYKQGQ